MTLLDQLPRLSAYDPGAMGEGGIDPLGFAALADRLADRLAPGIRARMSDPRYVTLSAIGAVAYQALHEMTADEGRTTVDIAFEWMVVEAFSRYANEADVGGLPGTLKAARAKAAKERLSRRTYLSGPRVFGFTGVYRPLSRDAEILGLDDLPARNAWVLLNAWERDSGLVGFVAGDADSAGGRLRKSIADNCVKSLEAGECACPPSGGVLKSLAQYLFAPTEKRPKEKAVLRNLLTTGVHEIRNELTAEMVRNPRPPSLSQSELTRSLMPKASKPTLLALKAAVDFEEAATAIDRSFRRFLEFTVQQHGSLISPGLAVKTPRLDEVAKDVGDLVRKARDSVEALGDVELAVDVQTAFSRFEGAMSVQSFFNALIARHEEVQAGKKKLSWLDQLGSDWTVRIPYRHQHDALQDGDWTHPMRLATLSFMLEKTA